MRIRQAISRMLLISGFTGLAGCSTARFPTVPKLDLERFMGTWYVAAGRFTFLEKEVHNAVEIYSYDADTKTILVDFTYRQGSFDGKVKKIPQRAKVVEGTGNAHWLVSPLWPFKFDYLVIALAPDYSWTAIGVPDQKYLWIMFRKKNPSREEIDVVIRELAGRSYNVDNLTFVPQKW